MIGPVTYALWALLLVFAGLDVYAHETRYRHGETFSAWIRSSRLRRAGTALALLVLFLHLVLRLF